MKVKMKGCPILKGIIMINILFVKIYLFLNSGNIYSQKQEEQDDIELEGLINHVVDGDTLDIKNIRIRFALIDTPERGQDGFWEAKKFVQICV